MGRKYKAYWTNGLIDWIDSLSIPPALFYLLLLSIIAVLSHLYVWAIELLPWGQFSVLFFLTGFWAVEAIAMIHFLIRSSEQAFDDFAPLLKKDKPELEQLRYEFGHLPQRQATTIAIIGASFGIFMSFYPPMSTGVWERPLLIGISSWVLSQIFVFEFIYRLYYQFGFVRSLYSTIPEVNLFYLGSIHSLAGFSARAGLAILVFAYINPVFLYTPGILSDPVFFVLAIIFTGTALSAFIIPLLGIRDRISKEKEKLARETGNGIQHLRIKIQSSIEDDDFQPLPQMRQALTALLELDQRIEAVNIWPWSASVFRGFLSAVLLPIVLWLLQQILSRLLSL